MDVVTTDGPVSRVSDRLGLGMLFRKIDAPYGPAGAGMIGAPSQVKASDPLGYSLDAIGSFLGTVVPTPAQVGSSAATGPAKSDVTGAVGDAVAGSSSVMGWLGNNLVAVIVGVLLLAVGLHTLVGE